MTRHHALRRRLRLRSCFVSPVALLTSSHRTSLLGLSIYIRALLSTPPCARGRDHGAPFLYLFITHTHCHMSCVTRKGSA